MDFFDAMNISASALNAQRERMNVVASNLANIHTTRTPDGGPYRKKSVVFEAQSLGSPFDSMLQDRLREQVQGVRVAGIESSNKPPLRVYDPSHPDADKDGYVLKPDINLMSEIVDMISASRSFEADVSAVKTSKNMALKALEIGR
ncbi:MAG: flagellar basal body rod protein FlgC [Deltaproteobacteria bacterium]|nr:flagellar basal body rod protein FlgC [Deltaproteobacteria bacterium]